MTDAPSIIAALQVPLTAGIFALLAAWLNTRIIKGQLEVSRQTLFVSMLPRRIEWLDKFRKAVPEWDSQMRTIIHYESDDPPEPTALFELERLIQESAWLFGQEVEIIAREMERQLKVVGDLRISAISGSKNAHQDSMRVGQGALQVYEMFASLSEAAMAKLFVGDIERPHHVMAKPKTLRERLPLVFSGVQSR